MNATPPNYATAAAARIAPHPEMELQTVDELREIIAETDEQLRIAKEAGDGLAATWIVGERRIAEAELARRNGNGAQSTAKKSPITICLSDVQREEVSWLWKYRIPTGKLSIIEGDPGVGKSQLTLAIAAPITRGLPVFGDDAGHEPGVVLIMSAGDGLGDTIRPRLDLMGADLSKVVALTGMRDEEGRERAVSLADLDVIEGAVKTHKPALVIIDPLVAYTGGADTHRANEVRGMLAPLAALAERHGCAVLAVRHLNKGNGRAIYRGQGSIDFLAACRSCFLVGKNPENASEKILVHIKSNLGPEMPSLTFSIDDGRFQWGEQSSVTADQLLAEPVNGEEKSQADEATEFLRTTLAKGALSSKEVIKAARENGISERTLWRAKKRLGVKASKSGFTGAWEWGLLIEACQFPSKPANSARVKDLAEAEWIEIPK